MAVTDTRRRRRDLRNLHRRLQAMDGHDYWSLVAASVAERRRRMIALMEDARRDELANGQSAEAAACAAILRIARSDRALALRIQRLAETRRDFDEMGEV